MKAPSSRVKQLTGVAAPMPFLRDTRVSAAYVELRQAVIEGAGFDYLAKCGDIMRTAGFTSSKPGVADRSRHKCADAIDFDQENKRVIVVREDRLGRSYFRIYLRCQKQDGSMGIQMQATPWDFANHRSGKPVTTFLFDFTSAAETLGFERIPAWRDWNVTHTYTMSEWWHYQMPEGLTWDEAMAYLYGKPSNKAQPKPKGMRVLGLNDRGEDVEEVQQSLTRLGFYRREEIDGIFGAITRASVRAFQSSEHITSDGLVGPQTYERLLAAVARLKA